MASQPSAGEAIELRPIEEKDNDQGKSMFKFLFYN